MVPRLWKRKSGFRKSNMVSSAQRLEILQLDLHLNVLKLALQMKKKKSGDKGLSSSLDISKYLVPNEQ